jgi:hypothetical protein
MQTGHVFKLAPSIFGIITYAPETRVLCRCIDTDSESEACAILARSFAGRFIVADADTRAWGKTIGRHDGSYLVLT